MPAPARLLDLTRLVSRLGRGPLTGVDRVEYAYLRHLLAGSTPLFGLARTALGFVLLDRAGAAAIAARASGSPLGRPDLLSRLTHRHNPARASAESDLRRLALARTHRLGLARMLRRHLPPGTTYLNTGHANLSPRVMRAAHAAGGRIAVLVHDTIPLDHPEFTRPGIPAVFARKLASVAAHADLVIHSATATRALTETHFARLGRTPPGIMAPLGLDLRQPETPPARAPYFVTIGTIEPRKNHALLLDVWQCLHATLPDAEIPHLLILGARGWSNADTFARLDSLPFMGHTVHEMPGLSDDQVITLLSGARALLFPSLAEGYGLPPLEAAALGIPVISATLPIYRESLGDYPVYVEGSDSYAWMKTILAVDEDAGVARNDVNRQIMSRRPPEWAEHFKTVLSLV